VSENGETIVDAGDGIRVRTIKSGTTKKGLMECQIIYWKANEHGEQGVSVKNGEGKWSL